MWHAFNVKVSELKADGMSDDEARATAWALFTSGQL